MVNPHRTITIITFNINCLNPRVKRQRSSEWIIKQDPTICYLQETHFKYKDSNRLKVNEGKRCATQPAQEECNYHTDKRSSRHEEKQSSQR